MSMPRRLCYALLVCSVAVLAISVAGEIGRILYPTACLIATDVTRLVDLLWIDPVSACLTVCQQTEEYYVRWWLGA